MTGDATCNRCVPSPVRRGGRRAFTLLELIVAITMASVIALTLAGSLRIAFKARDSAEAAVAPARAADVAADILRVDLESALLPRGLFAGSFIGNDGSGDAGAQADTLTFHASLPAGDEGLALAQGNIQGDIRRVELGVTVLPGTGEYALVRRVKSNLLAQLEEGQVQEEVLCRRVVSFGLRYFDGVSWRDSWDSTQEDDRLPQAMEVSLELQRPESTPENPQPTVRQSRVIRLPCATALPPEETGTGEGEAAPAQ
jgi:prepilin-type N-terminal cleavage/methylation domain-containing protein